MDSPEDQNQEEQSKLNPNEIYPEPKSYEERHEFSTEKPKSKLNLKLDYKVIIIVLLAIIIAMVVLWRPWETKASADAKTIKVTGQTTVKAEPDEFVFYPSYQFKNATKEAAIAASTAKSNEIVAKLKSLGVPENKIKTSSSGYDTPTYRTTPATSTYVLSITVTVNSAAMAQKVQDYLLTTSPTGSVSPNATFSDAKRKQLESQARDEATKDAKEKADQMAKNLGFKVGKVKTVDVNDGLGKISPLFEEANSASNSIGVTDDKLDLSYRIQAGENEINYIVSVEYYIK